MRGLCMASAEPLENVPGIPDAREAGIPGLNIRNFWSVHVPAKTPRAICEWLEVLFNEIAVEPETLKFNKDTGADLLCGNSKMLRDLLESETRNGAQYVKIANIQPMEQSAQSCSCRPGGGGRTLAGVNRDRGSRDPRDTGAKLVSLRFLLFAEEDVAVIDDPVDRENIQGAQTAFAAPAIIHGRDARRFQRLQHGLCPLHLDRPSKMGKMHCEWAVGVSATVAEGLETQFGGGFAALCPSASGFVKHADGATNIKFALWSQSVDGGANVDTPADLAAKQFEPVASERAQFVNENEIAARAAAIEDTEICAAPGKRLGH